MPPSGFADQFRQAGGPPGAPPGGAPTVQAGPPMAPPPMGAGPGMPPGAEDQVKQLLMQILMILSGQHMGGPQPGAPGVPGQSPGLPMS